MLPTISIEINSSSIGLIAIELILILCPTNL